MKIFDALAFNEFYNKLSSTNMDIKTAYKLTRIRKALDNDLTFYQEKLKEILDECIEQDDNGYKRSADGKSFIIKENKKEIFDTRFADLKNLEIDYDSSLKLDIDLLEGVKVKPDELIAINNFLK